MTTWGEGYFNEKVQEFIDFQANLFLDGWGRHYGTRGGWV
jgi:hypothetical protein